MNIYKYCILLVVALLFVAKANGQFAITYPSPSQGMNVCSGEGTLFVNLEARPFGTTTNILITVNMAPGVSYTPGSLLNVQSIPSSSYELIEENISNLSSPVFRVVNAGTTISASLSFGHSVAFNIGRQANCSARTHSLTGGSFKDVVSVEGSAGSFSENDVFLNSYSIQFPSLSFTQPDAINGTVVTGTYNRIFSISNGLSATTSQVYFYVIYPSGGITQNSLTLSGYGAITPSSTNGDTLFYTLSGTQLGVDNLLTNGEVLSFMENFTVNRCNAITSYAVGWGCNSLVSQWCQTIIGSGIVSMAIGSPSLYNAAPVQVSGFVDICTPYTYTQILGNNGLGDPTAAAMYNSIVRYSSHPTIGWADTAAIDYYDFRINGVPVTLTYQLASSGWSIDFPTQGFFIRINLAQLTSDPDGPGVGLEDLDGDGQFDDLPAGHSFEVSWTQRNKCESMLGCPGSVVGNHAFGANILYTNMCTPSTVVGSSVAGIGSIVNGVVAPSSWSNIGGTLSSNTISFPANILDGVPFRPSFFGVLSGAGGMHRPNNGNQRFEWRIILPAGASVAGSGNATWGLTPVPYAQNGDTIIIRGNNTSFNIAAIDLVYNCGGGGSVDWKVELHYINDIGTNCRCASLMFCHTTTRTIFCPGAVCAGGPSVYYPLTRRDDNSIYFTDNTYTTRANWITIPTINLQHATYFDTVRWEGAVVQNGAANNFYFELSVAKTTSGIQQLQPLDARLELYRGGVLINTCNYNALDFSTSLQTSSLSVFQLDLTNCFPSSAVLDGDSVRILTRFVVPEIGSELTGNSDQLALGRYKFYNLDGLGNAMSCNDWSLDLYLVRPIDDIRHNGSHAITFNGCMNSSGSIGIGHYHLGNDRFAGSEWRPTIFVDSIVVVIPNEYTFVSNSAIMGTPIINGNTYTYVNDGSWPYWRFQANSGLNNYSITLSNNCGAPLSALTLPFTAWGRQFFWADFESFPGIPVNNSNPISKVITKSINNTSPKPTIQFQDLSGNIAATDVVESIDFRVQNPTTRIAPFTWIAIPNNSNVTILSITDLATSTVLTPVPYANGVWFSLSAAGFAPISINDYRINFTYSNCATDSILVFGGWDCIGFPSDPLSYSCASPNIVLRFTPQATEIEVSLESIASNIDLCSPAQSSFVINNGQVSNVISNEFSIQMLTGTVIDPSTIEAEYPFGSGNWETVPSSINGSSRVVDLSAHTQYPVNGIPGLANAASNDDRQIRVRFNFQTDCDFVSGSSFFVQSSAYSPCGTLATGSNIPLFSPPIIINGVTTPYAITTTTSISSPVLNCNSTVSIDVVSTVGGGTTTSNATLDVVLPEGFSYAVGSLIPGGSNFPSLVNTSTVGGVQTIHFELPSGVTSGNVINYSFQINGSTATGCGVLPIVFQSFEQTPPVACAIDPTGFCTTSLVQTEFHTSTINLLKPDLVVTNSIGYQNAYNSAHFFTFYTLQNQGTTDLTISNPFTIDYYCANGSGDPTGAIIASHTYALNLPINGSLSFSDTLANPCGSLQDFVAIISDTSNCVCNEVRQLFAPIVNLGIDLTYFTVEKLSDISARVKWQTNFEDNTKYFIVERSTDLNSWTVIGRLEAAGNSQLGISYSMDDNALYSGVYYYRLKQFDTNGNVEIFGPQSVIFEIGNSICAVPNPSNSGEFNLMGVSSNARILVYDTRGVIVLDTYFDVSGVLNLSQFESGIYFAKIIENNTITELKLISSR